MSNTPRDQSCLWIKTQGYLFPMGFFVSGYWARTWSDTTQKVYLEESAFGLHGSAFTFNNISWKHCDSAKFRDCFSSEHPSSVAFLFKSKAFSKKMRKKFCSHVFTTGYVITAIWLSENDDNFFRLGWHKQQFICREENGSQFSQHNCCYWSVESPKVWGQMRSRLDFLWFMQSSKMDFRYPVFGVESITF